MRMILGAVQAFTDWLWGIPMLIFIIGGGFYLSVRLGFLQFTKLGFILKNTIGKAFGQKTEQGKFSSFQAVTGALASTLGAGNIIGTAMAIAYGVAGDYAYAIERAGGVPVLLPRTLDPETLHPLIDRLDSVLISGGHDVNPNLYGERIKGVCGRIVPERDVYDLEVTRYAYRTGKPILAICRGTQILNVAFGGTIYQDLEQNGFEHHFMSNSPRECPVHRNALEEGSILCSVFGSTVRVNSFHHQAVHDPGDGVTITARSEEGVPEGIEVAGGNSFVVGVQWHPEMMFTSEEQQKLFQALMAACGT